MSADEITEAEYEHAAWNEVLPLPELERPVPRLSDLVLELDRAAGAAKRAEVYATDAYKIWREADADAEVARQRYRRAVFQYETWRTQAEPT